MLKNKLVIFVEDNCWHEGGGLLNTVQQKVGGNISISLPGGEYIYTSHSLLQPWLSLRIAGVSYALYISLLISKLFCTMGCMGGGRGTSLSRSGTK
jgi:hypothetical protein